MRSMCQGFSFELVVAARLLELKDLFELELFSPGQVGYANKSRLAALPKRVKELITQGKLILNLATCGGQATPSGFVDQLSANDPTHILLPSTLAGPDGYANLNDGFDLAFGCRFYTQRLSEQNHQHNVRTTKLAKCYMLRHEDKENPQCAQLRKQALECLQSFPRSTIRFVFSFPGISRSENNQWWWCDGDDLVIIISLHNAASFFGPGTLWNRLKMVLEYLYPKNLWE